MRGRRLWLIWGLLALLAVVIWRAELQRSDEISAMSARETKRLLPLPIEEIGVVEVMAQGTMHRFERASNGLWFYHGIHDASQAGHEHTIDPAQSDTIAQAMTGFGRMQREQQIPLKGGDDEYGIARPEMFIIVYRTSTDAPLARYAAGNVTPDGYGRYLLPVGGNEIVTVPEFHMTNLLGLIDAMKSAAPVAASAGSAPAVPAAAAPTPVASTSAAGTPAAKPTR